MFKRFASYYRPHIPLFCLDMTASLLVSVTGIFYPVVTRHMLNDYIPERKYDMIVIAGAALLVIYLIRMLLNYFIQYKGHVMGVRMQAQMRHDMFVHLEKLPYGFFDNHETGKIMSRMTSDLMDISELAHHGPENIIVSTIAIITSFTYLSTINLPLTLIVFACVPFLVAAAAVTRKKMRNAFMRSRQSTARINAALESSISGIRVTKAYTNAEKETEKFEEGNREFVEARKDAYNAMGKFHSTTAFVTDIFNVIVLIAGGIFLYNGSIDFGDYSAFVVSVNLFISPVMTLVNFMEQYQNGVTGFERFVEILDAEPEKDPPDAEPIDRVEGHIEFKDVCYGYEDGRPVLNNISLDIKRGETFALVGPSGGGKTTICHLIPHFYSIDGGDILIDGKSINGITLDSLRKNIGIVQQDVYLFNASIKDNILYGNPNADDEAVIEAAKRANIHEYVMSLPEKYDTVIGERGVKLSGGQKQRLSIARVFLKDPPILILDEATSALDNVTEQLIQASLDELCKGRTTVVVAHRLSTVKNADEIAVIDEGSVVEQGSHKELLAQGGVYADLYNSQLIN